MSTVVQGKSLGSKHPFPNTTTDMTNMFKWRHGQKIYGTQAEEAVAWKEYRNDINKDWKNQKSSEKDKIYVDNFSEKSLQDQLEEVENK